MPFNKDNAVKHIISAVEPSSTGNCAKHTRLAIEAGGVIITRSQKAKDYGGSLIKAGFKELLSTTINYEKGDVVVIDGFAGNDNGHMAMYDGSVWISDFMQNGLYPGSGYRTHKPSFIIYRYSD